MSLKSQLDIEFDEYFLDDGDIEGYLIKVNGHTGVLEVLLNRDSKQPIVVLNDLEVIRQLAKFSMREISKSVGILTFRPKQISTSLSVTVDFEQNTVDVQVEQISNFGRFKDHSLTDIKDIIQHGVLQHFSNVSFDVLNLTFKFTIKDALAPLQQAIDFSIKSTTDIIEHTHGLLPNVAERLSLTSFFYFPEQVKSACIQYLVYFSQFLADLGIKGEVSINSDGDQNTIFKVFPTAPKTSLHRIRDALDAYLNLPDNNIAALVTDPFPDIAVLQLQANVLHLQGQLSLTKTRIQLKDAIIEAKDATIYAKEIAMQTLQNTIDARQTPQRQQDNDTEELIAGIVSVGKIEKFGFKISLAGILKLLKRKFNR